MKDADEAVATLNKLFRARRRFAAFDPEAAATEEAAGSVTVDAEGDLCWKLLQSWLGEDSGWLRWALSKIRPLRADASLRSSF